MFSIWAIEESFLINYLECILNASPKQIEAAASLDVEVLDILGVSGSVASIEINGPLSPDGPCFLARLFGFGGTAYNDIITAANLIKGDDSIKKVFLNVNSPGGEVQGVDQTYQAIAELAKTKEVIAINKGMMASAAYWLSSAATSILAESPSAETGSIGVVATVIDSTEQDKQNGIKEIHVVSRNAPDKVPDVTTLEGQGQIRERVDALERVFINRISEGRGISASKVAKDFGRGGVYIAEDPDTDRKDAISVGMIDGLTENVFNTENLKGLTESKTARSDDVCAQTKGDIMEKTLAELLKEFPQLAAMLEQIKTDACAGAEERVNAAAPYLTSEYPEAIKALAIGVLKGEKNPAALEGAIVALDAMKEQGLLKIAAEDTEETGETPGPDLKSVSEDGSIKESNYEAELVEFKRFRGMEG
jgi:ClpP class serine protease